MAAGVLPRVLPGRPDEGGAPPGRRSVLAERAPTLGWIVITPLAVLAVAWLFGLDRWSLHFSLAITLLPLALVPAWFVAAGAAVGRRWPLAVTAGLVVVVHLVALFPAVSPASAGVDADGAGLRLVTANARYHNATPDAWAEAVLELDADVLMVQEYSLLIADALDHAGVAERYPWKEGKALPWSAGVALFSRFPLRPTSEPRYGEGGVAATVEVGGRDVRVLNVHTAALPYQDAWRESFVDLERYLEDQPFPLIVAGDFNATLWHRPMRDLLSGPLRDAHVDRGRGLARSWPELKPGPPFALLDHVLVTPMIGVDDIAERALPGSDHRAVVTDLRLPAR